VAFLRAAKKDAGIIVSTEGATEKMMASFVAAIAQHRNWEREKALRPDLKPPAKSRR
jgi:hypothetical protein